MKADYRDILNTISDLIRDNHNAHASDYSDFPDGCVSAPYRGNCDCQCVAKPEWWDENGVPRFGTHHPTLAPSIYAYEVVLLLIRCAACGKEFAVQMDWSSMDDLRRRMILPDGDHDAATLSAQVKSGSIHYGDPPRHAHPEPQIERCAGETMNCDDIKVIEFWRRTEETDHEWARVPELERRLDDGHAG